MCDHLVEEESLHGNFFEPKKKCKKNAKKKHKKNAKTFKKMRRNAKKCEKDAKKMRPNQSRKNKTRKKKWETKKETKRLTEPPGGTSKKLQHSCLQGKICP